MADAVARLYLVAWVDTDDGENTNYDLIVLAESPAQAAALWNEYYAEHWNQGLDDDEKPEMRVPEHIIRIPEEELLCRKPRALVWASMDYSYPKGNEIEPILAAVRKAKPSRE